MIAPELRERKQLKNNVKPTIPKVPISCISVQPLKNSIEEKKETSFMTYPREHAAA